MDNTHLKRPEYRRELRPRSPLGTRRWMPWALAAFLLSGMGRALAQDYQIESYVMDGGGGGVNPSGETSIAHYGADLILYDSLNYYHQEDVGMDPTEPADTALWGGYIAQDLEGTDFDETAPPLGQVQLSLRFEPSVATKGGSASLILSGTPNAGVKVGGATVSLRIHPHFLAAWAESDPLSTQHNASAHLVYPTESDPDPSPYLVVGITKQAGLSAGEWARIPVTVSPDAVEGQTLTATAVFASGTDPEGVAYGEMNVTGLQAPLTVSSGTACLRGDVNQDRSINVSDAVKLLRGVAGLDTLSSLQNLAADVNGDRNVNVSDGVKLLRVIAELDPPLPAECPPPD